MRYRYYIIIVFFASFLWNGMAQLPWKDPYRNIEPEWVIESRMDSLSLIEAVYFYDEEEDQLGREISMTDHGMKLYKDFNTRKIHYPKVMLSEMKDTLYLPLFIYQGQKYVHPRLGKVTSRFGPRWGRLHFGTDVKLYTGDSVRCAFDGVVRIAQKNRSYGNIVVIRHVNGLESYYAHMSYLEVYPTQQVKAGEYIGLGGNTGRSRGAHLHFELRYLGNPFNPEFLIDFEKGELKTDTLMITSKTFDYFNFLGADGAKMYHTILKGETLSSIARKYHTTVPYLQALNKMTSTRIRAGAVLRVR